MPPDVFDQRYGRHRKNILARRFTTPESQIRKDFLGQDEKRLPSNNCGGDNHFARDCRNCSMKAFERKKLKGGSPVVHIFYNLTSKTDSIKDVQADLEETRPDKNIIGCSHFYLEMLDAIDKSHGKGRQNNSEDSNSSNSSSATYYIVSKMNEPYLGYFIND